MAFDGTYDSRKPLTAACAVMALVPLFSVLSTVLAVLFFDVPAAYGALQVLNSASVLGACLLAERKAGCGIGGWTDVLGVFFGFAAMICFYPGALLVSNLAGRFFSAEAGQVRFQASGSVADFGPVAAWVLLALLPSFTEEILCRGVLFTALRPYGRAFAVIWSAACFAAMHGSVQQSLYALYFGLVLAALREVSGSTVPCIVCHCAFNSVGVLALVLPQADLQPYTGIFSTDAGFFCLAAAMGLCGVLVLRSCGKYSHYEKRHRSAPFGILTWLWPSVTFFTLVAMQLLPYLL